MSQLKDLDYEIILAMADNDMNETQVSQKLYMHRNSIVYHCQKIKRITGKDPTRFYDLHDLVRMVKRRNIREGKNG